MENNIMQQYNYHNWANERVFDHLESLPDEVYDKQIESVFSSVETVVKHICQVDRLWLSVLKEDKFDKTMKIIEEHKTKAEGRTREGMRGIYDELSSKYHSFFGGVNDFNAGFTVNHPKYGPLDTTVAQLVQHITNHGTYHRGNITAMLRQQGHAGVPTDYIMYLYETA